MIRYTSTGSQPESYASSADLAPAVQQPAAALDGGFKPGEVHGRLVVPGGPGLGEVFERRFVEMDIACAGRFRQGARAGDMSGVEIDRGIVEMRIGGGDEVCRKALSTAKLKNTQRLGRKTRRDNAFRQRREGQILRA